MADNSNLDAHVRTYDKLIGMLKWGGMAVFFIAATVVWLISK